MFKTRLEHDGEVRQFDVVGTSRRRRGWPRMERRDAGNRRALVDRVRGEFLEMRGVSLTASEASRLLGIPQPICSRILHSLISEGALRLNQDSRYTCPESAP